MRYFLSFTTVLLAIAACNNSSSNVKATEPKASQPSATTSTKTTDQPIAEAGSSNAAFMINGQPAITVKATNNDDSHSASFAEGDKRLNIYILGYIAPDDHRHQLNITVKNFVTGTKGVIGNATAGFSRRDENKKEFLYGSRKEGNFKLTITSWEAVTDGPTVKAIISGTFEGDMEAENCFDPAIKSSAFCQPQHITSGTFDHVKVAFLK